MQVTYFIHITDVILKSGVRVLLAELAIPVSFILTSFNI